MSKLATIYNILTLQINIFIRETVQTYVYLPHVFCHVCSHMYMLAGESGSTIPFWQRISVSDQD